jgi:hypothetical protein
MKIKLKYLFILVVLAILFYVSKDKASYICFQDDYEKIGNFVHDNIDFFIQNNSVDTSFNGGFFCYTLVIAKNSQIILGLDGGEEMCSILKRNNVRSIYFNTQSEILFDISSSHSFLGISKYFVGYLPFSNSNNLIINRKKLEKKYELKPHWYSFYYFDTFAD